MVQWERQGKYPGIYRDPADPHHWKVVVNLGQAAKGEKRRRTSHPSSTVRLLTRAPRARPRGSPRTQGAPTAERQGAENGRRVGGPLARDLQAPECRAVDFRSLPGLRQPLYQADDWDCGAPPADRRRHPELLQHARRQGSTREHHQQGRLFAGAVAQARRHGRHLTAEPHGRCRSATATSAADLRRADQGATPRSAGDHAPGGGVGLSHYAVRPRVRAAERGGSLRWSGRRSIFGESRSRLFETRRAFQEARGRRPR